MDALPDDTPNALPADTSINGVYKTLFPHLRIERERRVTYVDKNKPVVRGRAPTQSETGFQVEGDERLRGNAFKAYARQRMAAVRFLKPGVPYLRFKHANIAAKQGLCLDHFQLADSSSYFFRLLQQHFGDDFDDLQRRREHVEYLGNPGHQGVAVLITDAASGVSYVFKLAHSVGHAGSGTGMMTRAQNRRNRKTWGRYVAAGGARGFIAQAKFQMIAAMHNCTVPVYACGVANDRNVPEAKRVPISFLVMPQLKTLAHDFIHEYTHPAAGISGEYVRQVYSEELMRKYVAAQIYNLLLKMDTNVGILHNDYNADNVMVDDEGDWVLIDFDLAFFFNHNLLQRCGLYPSLQTAGFLVKRLAQQAGLGFAAVIRLLQAYFHLVSKDKDVDGVGGVEDVDDKKYNYRKTPAPVPALSYKFLATPLTARWSRDFKKRIFGVQPRAGVGGQAGGVTLRF